MVTVLLRRDGIDVEVERGVCILRLRGVLDGWNAPDLRALVVGGSDRRCSRVLIDMSLLSEIDRNGVAMLEALADMARSRGMSMGIYAASGPVAEALGSLIERLP